MSRGLFNSGGWIFWEIVYGEMSGEFSRGNFSQRRNVHGELSGWASGSVCRSTSLSV